MSYKMIDSHCHLGNEKYQETTHELIQKSIEGGIIAMIDTGYDIPSSKKTIELANEFPQVFSTVGIHPHDAKMAPVDYLYQLNKLAANSKVVAIGEIGLDYYYDLSPRDIQQKVFKEQLDLSFELKRPFVIHQRDAMQDMLSLLNEFPSPRYGGMFHCYSGSLEIATDLVKKGYKLSIGGPLTFKNARKTVEVIKGIPIEHIMVETDCPYLTPEPLRGKLNYPHYVKYVIEKIAEIKGMGPSYVAAKTTSNSVEFFGLGLSI